MQLVLPAAWHGRADASGDADQCSTFGGQLADGLYGGHGCHEPRGHDETDETFVLQNEEKDASASRSRGVLASLS